MRSHVRIAWKNVIVLIGVVVEFAAFAIAERYLYIIPTLVFATRLPIVFADLGPRSASQVDGKEEALCKLLISLFDEDGLRRFVRYGPRGLQIEAELPAGTASLAQVSGAVVSQMRMHGVVDESMARLRDNFPLRAGDIEEVTELWKPAKSQQ